MSDERRQNAAREREEFHRHTCRYGDRYSSSPICGSLGRTAPSSRTPFGTLPAPAVTAAESFRPPVCEGEEIDEPAEVKKLYTREDRLIAKAPRPVSRRGPGHERRCGYEVRRDYEAALPPTDTLRRRGNEGREIF